MVDTSVITLTIDGQRIQVPPETSLLQAAQAVGVDIPTICYHEATTSYGLCRLCVVEVEGMRLLQPACIAPAAEGMVVSTKSPRVMRARRTILEMLSSSVDLSDAPEILAMLAEYNAEPERFPEAVGRQPEVLDDNPMFVRDYAKCVLCWRCVQVCAEDAQYTYAINFNGRGFDTQIATFFNQPIPETTCVLCGQCIGVCPSGALKPKREWLFEHGSLPEEINRMSLQPRRKRRSSS